MSFRSKLEAGEFAITAEIGPGKGTDVTEIAEVAELLRDRVSAANVTDQQSSVMRLGSMVTCHLLSDHHLEPILQMTCRDRNRIALQSDLLSAWVLGVENVLALTGDLPQLGDHRDAIGVYDLDSVQLLSVIGQLNAGTDMMGNELAGKTDFYAGAVVNPGADTEASFESQLYKMEAKIKAGAKFFQTQAIYEPDRFEQFMKRVEGFGVPVMAGIIPLKSVGMARFMNKNVSGVFVPEETIQKLAAAEDKNRAGLELAAQLMKDLKDLCQGIHIMPIGWEKRIPELLDLAGF
jgi:methylenetetrahydrofolate reductase (NADPH)